MGRLPKSGNSSLGEEKKCGEAEREAAQYERECEDAKRQVVEVEKLRDSARRDADTYKKELDAAEKNVKLLKEKLEGASSSAEHEEAKLEKARSKAAECEQKRDDARRKAAASDENLHVLFVGNPGVGKSTLLNSICGEHHFTSGMSTGGSGVTVELQTVTVNGVTYMDTIGVQDICPEKRMAAANSITKALRRGGRFKIVFVCRLMQGRPDSADKATMLATLDALGPAVSSSVEYGVIFNQVSKREQASLQEDPDNKVKASAICNARLPHQTACFHFEPEQNDALCENNKLISVSEELRAFLKHLPTCWVQGPKVETLRVMEGYVKSIETLTLQMETFELNQTELFKAMDEVRGKLDEFAKMQKR